MSGKALKKRRNRRLLGLALLLLVCLLAALWLWYQRRHYVETDDAYVRGNIVSVKALAAGTVVEIRAEDSQFVKAGQIVVRLQGHRAAIALEQAKAELGETVRRVQATFAEAVALRHRLTAREAEVRRIEHDLKRFRQVVAAGGVSTQQLENAEDRLREARAREAEVRAELRRAQSRVSGTRVENHPLVEAAKNRLRRAWLESVRQAVRAPLSGYVAKRRVQIGDEVRPGQVLLSIVPLDHLWVEAYFLENRLAPVRPGQDAEIRVDLYGAGKRFHGTVEGIWPATGSTFAVIPPDTASGNFIRIRQRVGVRIALDPAELRRWPLRPGLSTLTRIDTGPAVPLWRQVARSAASGPGQSGLRSLASPSTHDYRTNVYQDEMAGAERLISEILAANRVE